MSELFFNAQNLTVSNGFIKNPERYYLEDFFEQLPTLESSVLVTQQTSLISAVTSNNKNTFITTEITSSDVTASNWVEFTFNNSLISSSSVVTVQCIDSSDNTGSNTKLVFQVNNISTGSCDIRAINYSASASIPQVYKIAVMVDINVPSNKNFCIADSTGASATTSVTDTSVNYSSTRAGIELITTGTDNDTVVLLPRTKTSQILGTNSYPSAWSGILWGTENMVEWECAISIADISNAALWVGLKLTKTPVLATDANQAYFFFDSDDSVVGTITTNANLHFAYSIAGTDYTTNLGIAVKADTLYRLRLVIDNNRQAQVFVNEQQYGLTTTSGTSGLTVTDSTQRGVQLTNDIDLIPYIGVQSTTAAADTLTVYYQKMSRNLFE